MHTSYDKRTTPFAFQGQGLKVKVPGLTCYIGNKIKSESFGLRLSNLVKGQGDTRDINVKHQTEPF